MKSSGDQVVREIGEKDVLGEEALSINHSFHKSLFSMHNIKHRSRFWAHSISQNQHKSLQG